VQQQFTQLIEVHKGILIKVCNLYCDDTEDRRDLLQEIVLQLWKAYPKFRQESQFSTWMYKVSLNTAISYFRKQERAPRKRQLALAEYELPDLNTLAERNEKLTALQLAIEHLNRVEKGVVMLYLDEKTYEEIAAILGISVSNTGVILNRVKAKLATIIKTQQYAN
jgi:RNA polymerase sigma factor (sigma-70 family)